MPELVFLPFDSSDKQTVIEFVKKFYEEDPEGKSKTSAQVNTSIEWLQTHPQCGTIVVFKKGPAIVGYSILINFYSNEFNGLILNIDELYITPEFRSQGIATRFINYLIDTNFNNFVALELEVLPYNERALELYKKLGFKVSDRSYLMLKK